MRNVATFALALSALSMWSCKPDPAGAVPADVETATLDIAHAPVEMVVMLDTSMSMTNHQLGLARSLLAHLIHALNDADQFGLVLFADEASVTIESSHATSESKTEWLRHVEAIEVEGLTNLEDALELMRTLSPETRVVLVTDGSPTWGNVVADELARTPEGLDLWTVGVGRNNDALLRRLGHYLLLKDPAEVARSLITLDGHDGKAAESPPPEHRGH